MTKKEIYDMVYEYDTQYEEGFMPDEIMCMIDKVKLSGHNWVDEKYNSAMMGNTCTMHDGKFCMYHCDVYVAIICAIENRDQTIEEWD